MAGLGGFRRRRLGAVWVELQWRRFADDPHAFLGECVFIPSPGSRTGRVLFDLFDYQQDTLDRFLDERFLVVLKARQLGLTTLAMAYALWLLLFRPGSNVVLVSETQRKANRALTLMDFMWQFLPGWLKGRAPELVVDSATEHVWRFADGLESRIVSIPATKTAGAGETATLVLWDEAALASEQDDAYRSLKPTTDAGGQMIVFSTARGAFNRFARLFREAQRGENEFGWLFHPWYVSRFLNGRAGNLDGCRRVPCSSCVDRTLHEAKRRDFADEPWLFFSEYPEDPEEAFKESGRSRFADLPDLVDCVEFGWRGRLEGGRLVEDEDGPLRLRREFVGPAPSWAKTVVAVDPSGGVGVDYTAITLGWQDQDGNFQRVGFWHDNRTEPVDVAAEAAGLGWFFRGGGQRAALLVVEKAGGWGDTVINELQRTLSYPALYVHRKAGSRRGRTETAFGFPITAQRRPLVIDKLAQLLPSSAADKPVVLVGLDPLLRHELGAFVVKPNGRVEADVGMHDDLVMSTAIWAYVVGEVGPPAVTPRGSGEPEGRRVRVDVSHIFEEAERVRQASEPGRGREGRSVPVGGSRSWLS